MFIDSHCHPDLLMQPSEDNLTPITLAEILQNMHDNKVFKALCIGVSLDNIQQVLDLANQNPQFFATVGVHPEYSNEQIKIQPTVDNILEIIQNNPKVIAVGEIGLDYHWHKDKPQWQKERFALQIQAALQAKKPVIIHSRDAFDDTFAILKSENASQVGGIIHCFTGNIDDAKTALDLGFYVSFSGIVTFKSAKEIQEAAKYCPADRILIETDSPFLAPVPFRGKTNQPAYVRYVAEFLATLRKTSVENISQITCQNFHTLFPTTTA